MLIFWMCCAKVKMRLCQVVVLALFVWEVTSDCINPDTAMFESECRRIRTNPYFAPKQPPNWGLMLDSFDFQNLVDNSNPAWVLRDVDGDGGQWGQRGGICQYNIRACSYQLGQQDNWFFTNYIIFPTSPLVDEVTEVYFNTNFRFSQCTDNPACTHDFATVYKFDSNLPAQVFEQRNPANHQPLRSTEIESRLQQVGSTDTSVIWRIPKSKFPAAGFYLGFRDTGTCGQVKKIFVYYMKAPMYSNATTLLTCPNVPLPPQGSSGTTRGTCCCGEKATNASSLERVCRADGTCEEPSSDACGCQPGYEFVNNQCVACSPGTFQTEISRVSKCVSCPVNSVALFPAAAVCNCTGATIRNINRPRDPCTGPPSPPLLTVGPVVDERFVSLCWGAALDSGGLDDLHYNIYIHLPGVDGPMYRKVNNEAIKGKGEICYNVSGIKPMSSYAIVVTSANGATGDPKTLDQSLTTVDGQYVAFFVDTGEPVTVPLNCPTTSPPVTFTTPTPTGDCPICPASTCTCPPPVTCPTCPTTSEPTKFPDYPATFPPEPEKTNLKFVLGSKTYLNNTNALITDIGEGENGLECMTTNPDCCKPPNGNTKQGEFYYPDNTAVGFSSTNSLYRNRGLQLVRLNRRNDAVSPTGRYRCEIPDSSGKIQNIYINITRYM